ncbi:hypothetical protein [Endozoicomonas elysicola]|uniref:Uncharacterized protein n=1 Tax=Endozoicomonas elysicola TaxID=305900 RepID=A0A081K5U1_9GAMM|nr:hypothetical protein [Endozoicomonas elysicola]KEI69517.1 hypothetical protein GV64_01075 [Endozoicomonas elysicola]
MAESVGRPNTSTDINTVQKEGALKTACKWGERVVRSLLSERKSINAPFNSKDNSEQLTGNFKTLESYKIESRPVFNILPPSKKSLPAIKALKPELFSYVEQQLTKNLIAKGYSKKGAELHIVSWKAVCNDNFVQIADKVRSAPFLQSDHQKRFNWCKKQLIQRGFSTYEAEHEATKAVMIDCQKSSQNRSYSPGSSSEYLINLPNPKKNIQQKYPPSWGIEWLMQSGYSQLDAEISAECAWEFFAEDTDLFALWAKGLSTGEVQNRKADVLFEKYGGNTPDGPDADIREKVFAELSRLPDSFQSEIRVKLDCILPPEMIADDLLERFGINSLEGADYDVLEKARQILAHHPKGFREEVIAFMELLLNPEDDAPLYQAPPPPKDSA